MDALNYMLSFVKREQLYVGISFNTEYNVWQFDMRTGAKSHLDIYCKDDCLHLRGRYDLKKKIVVTTYFKTTKKLLDIFVRDVMYGYAAVQWLNCLKRHNYRF